MQDKFQFFPMLVTNTNIISSLLCLKTMKKDKIMVNSDYGCIDSSKKTYASSNSNILIFLTSMRNNLQTPSLRECLKF